jgi:hypothetical protein
LKWMIGKMSIIIIYKLKLAAAAKFIRSKGSQTEKCYLWDSADGLRKVVKFPPEFYHRLWCPT